ncbi:16S rRNA (uracil(1498)-N(3))-methyltransferase [Paenibacillus sp. CFBP13512]|uniref:16S rRNA (uracil(1498)-N(3))-methyltransferase n=1 Tax=Paenibacillus sp. CFBP13512 TaxID=2184007 RepID=UPI0010C030B9|nr:16S rRNA (uracil(1498)-N(3))-methyltransferase [Paenibacillus sp. CFBP13512]TKJ94309.1 16S rRNA (uracil(1498)-N(3))-methyltransferase [Paenibacillus sp. CFBP13512]
MQRYFVPADQFDEQEVRITGEDARHISRVMRSRVGDQVIACNGQSLDVLVEITELAEGVVTASIVETLEQHGEPNLFVTIAQSLPKADKMESVIQKCTEIGASSFLPFLSERTVVQYDERKEVKRIQRWSKIAKEAAEQSHRSRVPLVESPVSWKQLLKQFADYDLICFCYEKENGHQLRDVVQPFVQSLTADHHHASNQVTRVMIVVGPEGGFSEQEVAAAEANGAVATGLGRRILRTETAAMTALACIMYETGEMSANNV